MPSLAWLSPAVWWGAAVVALPVLIHLLVRQQSRRVPFPSLRFLAASAIAATRRHRIQDWWLLALRIAVLLAAVSAWATPVFRTPARDAAWATRVARAVVVEQRGVAPDDELRSAFVGAAFIRADVRDAIVEAAAWLAEQKPPARELVILSTFARGAVDPADLSLVPADVGVRLERTGDPPALRERERTLLQWRDGALFAVDYRLSLGADDTSVQETGARAVADWPISVRAPEADQATADAALRAVLTRGVQLPAAGILEPMAIDWPGSVQALARAIDERLHESMVPLEPERVPEAQLATWARPIPSTGVPQSYDEGDRRWFWALLLLLLAVESWVRRG